MLCNKILIFFRAFKSDLKLSLVLNVRKWVFDVRQCFTLHFEMLSLLKYFIHCIKIVLISPLLRNISQWFGVCHYDTKH